MTELLEKAIEALRRMPAEGQDAFARMVLEITEDEEPQDIPPEHLDAVLEGLAQADRGEFATDEEVAEVLARFRR